MRRDLEHDVGEAVGTATTGLPCVPIAAAPAEEHREDDDLEDVAAGHGVDH